MDGPLPITVSDFEARARTRMDPAAYDYYAGGAADERTLAANRAAFDRVVIHPRILVDVSRIDARTSALGEPLAMPIGLAPTAFNRLAHPDGELAAARVAGGAGTLMVVSTVATYSLEEIAAAATGPLWFQLYVYKDRAVTRDLVDRAARAGYRALVLTVDAPVLGRRERDERNRFRLPPDLTIRNLETSSVASAGAARWTDQPSFFAYVHDLFDASLTWEALDWLRSITRLPIVLKGILSPEDARLAVEHGAAALVEERSGAGDGTGGTAVARRGGSLAGGGQRSAVTPRLFRPGAPGLKPGATCAGVM
jgi:4-hydroxymandelate oxidase